MLHPANSLRPLPYSAATGAAEPVEAGVGRRSRGGGGGGACRAPPFFSKTGGGGGVLSLGHVIVSEARELRGSRRLVTITKRSQESASLSHSRRRCLSSSRPARGERLQLSGPGQPAPAWRSRKPLRLRPASSAPTLLRVCKRRSLYRNLQPLPTPQPCRKATAYSSTLISASCRRGGRRGLPEPSSLLLTSLSSPEATRPPAD